MAKSQNLKKVYIENDFKAFIEAMQDVVQSCPWRISSWTSVVRDLTCLP